MRVVATANNLHASVVFSVECIVRVQEGRGDTFESDADTTHFDAILRQNGNCRDGLLLESLWTLWKFPLHTVHDTRRRNDPFDHRSSKHMPLCERSVKSPDDSISCWQHPLDKSHRTLQCTHPCIPVTRVLVQSTQCKSRLLMSFMRRLDYHEG